MNKPRKRIKKEQFTPPIRELEESSFEEVALMIGFDH